MKTSRYYVLLYHGVHADDLPKDGRNSSGKHISRKRFSDHMQFISENFPLVSMREIAAAHRGDGSLDPDSVAVTFDDGFLNNYTEAWPVIEKYRVPVTIYLATGFIGTRRVIWTDQIETAILNTPETELRINLDGRTQIYALVDEDARIAALSEVKGHCKAMAYDIKDAVVNQICAELGAQFDPSDPLCAFLDWDQVRQMSQSDWVDFGAHTVDHVSLTKVPYQTMRAQIDRSLDDLQQELNGACPFFSYPEGQADDFDENVISHLKSKGIDHAPTAIDGVNHLGETDSFHIRRIMVGFEDRPFPFAEI